MRKLYQNAAGLGLLLFSWLALGTGAQAQSRLLPNGNQTPTSASQNSTLGNNTTFVQETLFSSTELGGGGQITAITIYPDARTNWLAGQTFQGVQIYLKDTSLTTWGPSSSPPSTNVLISDVVATYPSTPQFTGNIAFSNNSPVTINLTTPFTYSGGAKRLAVLVVRNAGQTINAAAYGSWYSWTTTDLSTRRFAISGSLLASSAFTSSAYTTFRPGFRFTIAPDPSSALCSGVPDLSGTNPTQGAGGSFATGVTLSHSLAVNTRGVSYKWQRSFDQGATDPWTDVAGATQARVEIVRPGINYYYRIVATCSGGGTSASPGILVTEQSFPYLDGFNSPAAGGSAIVNANNDAQAWLLNTAGNRGGITGANSYLFQLNQGVGGNDYVTFVPLDLVAGRQYRVSIWLTHVLTSASQNVQLRVGTAPTAAALTNTVATWSVPGSSGTYVYSEYTANYTPSTSGVYYFALYVNQPAATGGRIHADDLTISAIVNRDLQITALTSPVITNSCRSIANPITVTVRNNGIAAFDFSNTPATFTANVTGASTGSYSVSLTDNSANGGVPLGAGQSMQVTIGSHAFNAIGTHALAFNINSIGDELAGNNAVNANYAVTSNLVVTPTPTTSYRPIFSSSTFTTDGWTQATIRTGTAKAWAVNTAVVTTASTPNVNLVPPAGSGQDNVLEFSGAFDGTKIQRLATPCVDLTQLTKPRVRVRWFQEASFTNADRMRLLISINGGVSYDTLANLDRQNSALSTPGWSNITIPIDAYKTNSAVTFAFETWSASSRSQGIADFEVFEAPPVPDLAISFVSPAPGGCYSSNTPVVVRISNIGGGAADFTADTTLLTLTSTAPTGGINQTLTKRLTGVLAGGGTVDVTLDSPGLNMGAFGTYTINANVSVATGETVTTNNALSPAVGRVVLIAAQNLPLAINFSNFDGSNLFPNGNTAHPGWSERNGATLLNTDSPWTQGSLNGQTTAVVSMTGTLNAWILAPKTSISANTRLTFFAGMTSSGSTAPVTSGNGLSTSADDRLEVYVSTNCGSTWNPIYAFFNGDVRNLGAVLQPYTVNLSAYAGQEIIVAFNARSTVSEGSKTYDLHIDDIKISNRDTRDVGVARLINPLPIGCYSGNNVAVTASVINYGTASINAGTVIPVTASWSGPATGSIAGSITLASALAPGAAVSGQIGTANLSVAGTYLINATTSLSGDTTASNNSMPSVYRVLSPTGTAVSLSNDFEAETSGALPATWTGETGADDFQVTSGIGFGGTGKALRTNVWGSNARANFILPTLGPVVADAQVQFQYRITDYSASASVGTASILSPGDKINVNISTNCGLTYNTVASIGNNNHVVSTNYAPFTFTLPSSYIGQLIILQVEVLRSVGDYWVDVDNFKFGCDPTQTVWKGINTNWNDPINWSACTGVPTATISAIIPNVNNKPIVTGNVAVKDLTLTTGTSIELATGSMLTVNGVLTNNATIRGTGGLTVNESSTVAGTSTLENLAVASGKTLTVTGTITATNVTAEGNLTVNSGATLNVRELLQPVGTGVITNNGTVRLQSASQATARLGALPSNGSYVGDIIQERFFDRNQSTSGGSYYMLGSPVRSFRLVNFASGGNTISGIPNGPNPTGSPSIQQYDPFLSNAAQGWYTPTNAQAILAPGNGALVYIYPQVVNSGSKLLFTGVPERGIGAGFALPVQFCSGNCPTSGGSLNLVSNPLPSPINFDAITRTDVEPYYIVYSGKTGSYLYYHSQLAFLSSPGMTSTIPTAQGFFLVATGSGASARVPESAKVSGNTPVKSNSTGTYFRVSMANNSGASSEATVGFVKGATKLADQGLDVAALTGSTVSLTTYAGGTEAAINVRPELAAGNDTIWASATGAEGSYTLTFDNLAHMPATMYLVDTYTNNVNLVTPGFAYSFDINADANSRGRRFQIVAASGATSIKAVNNGQSFRVFPNPSNGTNLNYMVSGYTSGNYVLQVTDMVGRVIATRPAVINGQANSLDLNLSAGVYNVVLTGEGSREIRRIVVQ